MSTSVVDSGSDGGDKDAVNARADAAPAFLLFEVPPAPGERGPAVQAIVRAGALAPSQAERLRAVLDGIAAERAAAVGA